MKMDKHGRSFLIKRGDTKEVEEVSAPVKEDAMEELIAGLHRSGSCSQKELAITFGIPESEVERIVSKEK